MREFCIALLAGWGVGALGGAVGTAQVDKAPATKAQAVKRAAPTTKARPRAVAPAATAFSIPDCPLPSAAIGSLSLPELSGSGPLLAPPYSPFPQHWPEEHHWLPRPTPPGPISPVPEPGAWAMMIGGFGLVGMSMRARRVSHA